MTRDRPDAGDGPGGGGNGTDSDALDAVHHALADRYRREVLRYLVDADERIVPVSDLVEHALDRDPARDREVVATRFHHATLPALAETDFVAFDEEGGVVAYSPEPMLERELERAGTPADD